MHSRNYGKTPLSFRLLFAFGQILVLAALWWAFILLFSGCGSTQTVIPPVVHSQVASWDGGEQTSGILSTQNGLFIVTSHFHDRYLALALIYGKKFEPVLDPARGVTKIDEATFSFAPEAMQNFLKMNRWRRNETTPIK